MPGSATLKLKGVVFECEKLKGGLMTNFVLLDIFCLQPQHIISQQFNVHFAGLVVTSLVVSITTVVVSRTFRANI